MSELPFTQKRLQALQRYMRALECGDVEAIAAVLEDGAQDQGLERMILEVNTVYQHEDHTIVRAADALAAQEQLMQLTKHKTGREKMYTPPLNSQDDSDRSFLPTSQIEPADNNERSAARKMQGKKFATPVFPAKMVVTQKWYTSRKSWIAASAAAILIAILLLPGTSVLANQMLSLFTVKNFQPVQITTQDTAALSQYSAPRIDDLGSINFQAKSLPAHNNLTQQQAEKSTNFAIKLPSQLPDGVANSPSFSIFEGGHGVFTFSAAKVHAYLVKNRHGNVKIPANLDGATFDVTMTAGILAKYGYHGGNPFLVAELPSPLIRATGSASLEQLRDFMLSLPGLPASLVAQLKHINFTNGTIPLPVPAGIDARSVTVNGASGVLLSTNKTTTIAGLKDFPNGSLVVWQTKGIIYALGGVTTNLNQLLASANSI